MVICLWISAGGIPHWRLSSASPSIFSTHFLAPPHLQFFSLQRLALSFGHSVRFSPDITSVVSSSVFPSSTAIISSVIIPLVIPSSVVFSPVVIPLVVFFFWLLSSLLLLFLRSSLLLLFLWSSLLLSSLYLYPYHRLCQCCYSSSPPPSDLSAVVFFSNSWWGYLSIAQTYPTLSSVPPAVPGPVHRTYATPLHIAPCLQRGGVIRRISPSTPPKLSWLPLFD